MSRNDLQLKVAEAIQDDVNKGIVRFDTPLMKEIEVRPGDIVEIQGERTTVAIVDRALPGDIGQTIIRMDGLTRRNAKTTIGENVRIRKGDVVECKKVTIAPARKGIMIRASPQIFKRGLLGRAVVKGDIVSLGGARRRRTMMNENPFFDDIFSMFGEDSTMGFGLGDLKFVVVEALPAKKPVLVTENTRVVFNPEAVEVKEDQRIDVTYEDIGGLDEELKKIREMVELPLKHPEIFERLGIEPPKGVLLHGPPGTGKTLLAKAVANETNSNFILINGPEIMSKFYGQSLPAEEEVLVVENGLMKRMPIGDIVDGKKEGLQAVCFDKNGAVTIKPVTDLIKHETIGKLLNVQTKSGRSITVTDYHSLFTLGKRGVESIKTADLKANESFIAVPRNLPFPERTIERINLLPLLAKEDHGLRVRNAHLFVQEAKDKIGLERTAEILNVREKYVYDIISKHVMLPVHSFLALVKEAEIPYEPHQIALSTKGKSIPAVFELTEDLCAFFGVWLAEGSYTNKNEVRISVNRNEEIYLVRLCTALFGPVTVYRKPGADSSDIIICSGALGKVMRHALGFTSGARNKRVPDWAFNINRTRLSALLRGYISGDGSVNTKTPAPRVEVSSESPKLIDDVAHLMLRFGIVGKIYGRTHRPQKRYTFANVEDLDAFRDIGFFASDKNQHIAQYVRRVGTGRRDHVPLLGDVADTVHTNPALSAWRESESIGRDVPSEHAPALLLQFQEVYWDKVTRITEVPPPQYVYDIGVEGHHNFVAGFGGIFAHNSEENLRKKFEDAEKNAPSIIFIDEIDAIASKREESKGEVERRVVAQLLAMMDGLHARGKVVVIAATNIPNQLDPALRRPGRFDREIEIGVPQYPGRLNILKIHTRNMPLADKGKEKVDLEKLAAITHGFVGADLSALAKEAAMIVLRRVLPDVNLQEEEELPNELLEKLIITNDDFLDALKVVRPSALREVLIEMPNVTYADIGGLSDLKQELIEAVEWPLKHKDAFARLGIRPPKGILLYGPPGTGKTLLAKAVAKESEANFISVKGPELLSKWVGESEKAVRKVFEKARQTSPCVVFFDELDSLAPHRGASDANVTERVVNQLLTEIDGMQELNDVVVIAATNRPDMIDSALLRPGRFDRILLVPVPEKASRKQIFQVHLAAMRTGKDVDIDALVEKTDGYVGADIAAMCREAAMLALRENMKTKDVGMRYFEKALQKIRPSVNKQIEKAYAEFEEGFRQARGKEMADKPSYYG